jgi:hypothetical protein
MAAVPRIGLKGATASAGSGTIAVAPPTAYGSFDYILLVASTYADDSAALDADNGFSELGHVAHCTVWGRSASGYSGNTNVSGATNSIVAYTIGVALCGGKGGEAVVTDTGTDASIEPAAFETTADNELVFIVGGMADNNGVSSITAGNLTGTGSFGDSTATGSDTCCLVMYGLMASAGSIGSPYITANGSDPWGSVAFALKATTDEVTSPATFYTFGGGSLECGSATYATACSGAGTLTVNVLDGGVTGSYLGQTTNFYVRQHCHQFDTVLIPDGATITAATLYLYSYGDASVTDFVTNAYAKDFGDTLTTADFVAGADLSALTKLASWNSSGYAVGYRAFTSEDAFLTAIDKTGPTRILLASQEQADQSQPSANEAVGFYTGGDSSANRAKLVVSFTTGAAGGLMPHIMCHHFIPQQLGGH